MRTFAAVNYDGRVTCVFSVRVCVCSRARRRVLVLVETFAGFVRSHFSYHTRSVMLIQIFRAVDPCSIYIVDVMK